MANLAQFIAVAAFQIIILRLLACSLKKLLACDLAHFPSTFLSA